MGVDIQPEEFWIIVIKLNGDLKYKKQHPF